MPQDARGQGGLRGVLGTWLNLPLPLVGVYVEVHPTLFLAPSTGLGIGGTVGVSVGL